MKADRVNPIIPCPGPRIGRLIQQRLSERPSKQLRSMDQNAAAWISTMQDLTARDNPAPATPAPMTRTAQSLTPSAHASAPKAHPLALQVLRAGLAVCRNEQTLAVFIHARCRSRQRATLAARNDSLKTRRGTFNFGHGDTPGLAASVWHGFLRSRKAFWFVPQNSSSSQLHPPSGHDFPAAAWFLLSGRVT